jgi:hypothetical protein
MVGEPLIYKYNNLGPFCVDLKFRPKRKKKKKKSWSKLLEFFTGIKVVVSADEVDGREGAFSDGLNDLQRRKRRGKFRQKTLQSNAEDRQLKTN